jgi:DNA repair protein SbcC/Rad50
MCNSDEAYVIRRKLRTRALRKKLEESVEVKLSDGECLTGSKAELFLDRLHRSTFRDFATTVYQHQEVIRAIVTLEPRDRDDAIDRLLGLSDHRNLLNALKKVDAKHRQKDFLVKWNDFETEMGTALNTRENDLKEYREKATQGGIPRNKLNAKASLTFAGEVMQALGAFAREASLEPPSLVVPEEWTGLRTFCDKVKAAITCLRGEVPGIKEQEQLIVRRTQMAERKADLESAKNNRDEIGKQIRELDKEYRSQNEIDKQITEVRNALRGAHDRLRRSNSRAILVRESITYLKLEAEKERVSNLCPLCGNEAAGLLETLHRLWEERLQAQTGEIGTEM